MIIMNQIKTNIELLGGEIEIVAYDLNPSSGQYLLENIHMEGIRLEKIFNLYDEESEISILNKNKKINPSKEMFFVLSRVMEISKQYPKYNPFLGKNIINIKMGLNHENIDFSYDDIFISENLVEIKNENLILDLGSAAKGYIADCLVKAMKEEGIDSGFLDARGDLVIFGNYSEDVEFPTNKNNEYENYVIEIKESAIATSGNESQGKHILNEGSFSNVSVISKNLFDADIFSTVCFTMTEEELQIFSKEHPQIKIFAKTKNNEELSFNGFLEKEKKIRKNVSHRKTRAS